MISYAQNSEDVVLMRGLSHVPKGFYIDVGAAHPNQGNASYAFYRKGWAGVNTEPDPRYFGLLRRARPRDVNLNVGVGAAEAALNFYRFPNAKDCTFDRQQADALIRDGSPHQLVSVPVTTLNRVLHQHPPGPVHFLKIDAGGAEKAVLEGVDLARLRPWIIVVKAVEPGTNVLAEREWQPVLAAANYVRCLFDGVNAFYCAAEHADVAARISYPANYLDKFVPASFHAQKLALTEKSDTLSGFRRSSQFHAKFKHKPIPAPDFSQSGMHQTAPAFREGATSRPVLVFDISNLAKSNMVTGIERVVLNMAACLQRLAPDLSHELVFVGFNGKAYSRLDVHLSRVGDRDVLDLSGSPQAFALKPGDIWLSCELFGEVPKLESFYLSLKQRGVLVCFWVHDLFPLIRPEWSDDAEVIWFGQWWHTVYKVADKILCGSWKVQVEVERWISMFPRAPDAVGAEPVLAWFHLGADGLQNVEYKEKTSQPLKATQAFELRKGARASFMCLASLHPRKALEMLIDAFDILWEKGMDVDLVLTGRIYSRANPVVARIENHPRLNKTLFYTGYVTDRALEKLLGECDGLIFPSYDEGFGLPVVEAMRAGVPVLLRDIPVFREVAAGRAVSWFADEGPEAIAAAVAEFLDNPPPSSVAGQADSALVTWSQVAVHMLDFVGVARRVAASPPGE